ncbi:hypothetical protein [Paludibaculum fermentans]|uniref:hypothetical protein n=1 Tax=Paludibaculum fermentans TaxID=1473598 RepID=UPI003EB7A143
MNKRLSLLLLFTSTLFGQHILYNETRDKVAKETLEAAKQVASKPLSETEMRNLGVIEQSQLKSAIEWYRVTMRTNIQAFRTWGDVRDAIDQIRTELDDREKDLQEAPRAAATKADLEARQKAIEEQIEGLKKPVAKAKDAARAAVDKAEAAPGAKQKEADSAAKKKDSGKVEPSAATQASADLKALGERVGQFDELLGLAAELAAKLKATTSDTSTQAKLEDASTKTKAVQDAVKDIQKGIQEVQELAATIGAIIDTWNGVKVDPASLAPSPEKIALELLEREAEYIKTLTAIRVRRYMEVAETRNLLRRFDVEFARCRFIAGDLNTPVTDDLTRFMGNESMREGLEQRLYTLLLAAHISARQTADQTMNDVRESIEFRRYRVKVNSVYNASYETALQAAAGRLAAYYASGLKPTQLAQFVYELGTAVALPYVAVTK